MEILPLSESIRALVQKRNQQSSQSLRKGVKWSAIIVSLLLVFFFGYDLAIEAFVFAMPPRWDAKISQFFVPDDGKVIQDPKASDALTKIGKRLLASEKDLPYDFRFYIEKKNEPNAYALPGGVIVFYTGLIQFADTPDEIAGIMAHEIQHVLKRHSMKQLAHVYGMRILLSPLNDSMVKSLATTLMDQSYSRREESEADSGAIALLDKAKITPNGLIHFLEKIDSKRTQFEKSLTFLSSHPSDQNRIQTIRKTVSTDCSGFDQPVLTDAEWKALKT